MWFPKCLSMKHDDFESLECRFCLLLGSLNTLFNNNEMQRTDTSEKRYPTEEYLIFASFQCISCCYATGLI